MSEPTTQPGEIAQLTYAAIAQRAKADPAFRDGLLTASAVCRAQGTDRHPCPSTMSAVYIDRLANGEQP